MKFARTLPVAMLALAFVMVGTARAKSKGYQVNLTFNATVAGTPLSKGSYNVQWQTHSPQATITFTKGGKTVATAEGKVVDRGTKYDMNQIVYMAQPDGTRQIQEIRFQGLSQVIDFN